jgi:hypothetical protein
MSNEVKMSRVRPLVVLTILFVAALFMASCAVKRVDVPRHEGVTLEQALADLRSIKSIEAVLAVEYRKEDSVMTGDAFLSLSDKAMTLRLYYLGFLAGEITEEEGAIRSTPKIDRKKSTLLVDGLRSGIFWWNVKDYTVEEDGEFYTLRNTSTRVSISKDTLLPVEQVIELNNGDSLRISYNEPARIDVGEGEPADLSPILQWYPSRLNIELRNHAVRIKVKSYSFKK